MPAKTRSQFRHGFTLPEILIVIAIIAALSALVYPITRAAIAKSHQTACLGNLRTIGIGIESYLQDHGDVMPNIDAGRYDLEEEVPTLEGVLKDYIEDPAVFHCPADKVQFTKSGSSYLWNSTQSGRNKLKLEFFGVTGNSSLIPLVTDKEAWHPGKSGVNILYADYSAANVMKFATSP